MSSNRHSAEIEDRKSSASNQGEDVLNKKESQRRFEHSTNQAKWESMFTRLCAFKKRHGHCLVPNRYTEDQSLGSWVSTQRRHYKTMISGSDEMTPMNPQRVKRLEAIGFKWETSDPRHVPWETRLEQLKDYKEKFGHCMVPVGYKRNPSLSNWVSTQRQEYKLLREGRTSRLTRDQVDTLDRIGFVWEAHKGRRRKRDSTELTSTVPEKYTSSKTATHPNPPSEASEASRKRHLSSLPPREENRLMHNAYTRDEANVLATAQHAAGAFAQRQPGINLGTVLLNQVHDPRLSHAVATATATAASTAAVATMRELALKRQLELQQLQALHVQAAQGQGVIVPTQEYRAIPSLQNRYLMAQPIFDPLVAASIATYGGGSSHLGSLPVLTGVERSVPSTLVSRDLQSALAVRNAMLTGSHLSNNPIQK